jgi:uroporphyrinogen decarboxylase
MDSRERTFLTLRHQEADRIPRDCWMSEATKAKIAALLKMDYNDFLEHNDIDIRYIDGPEFIGQARLSGNDALDSDVWGVGRKVVGNEYAEHGSLYTEWYKELAFSPLSSQGTLEEIIERYRWPSADDYDYSSIERQCDAIRDKGRVVAFMGDRLHRISQLKPAMYLRGMENILLDFSLQPELARFIIGNIHNFYHEYAQRILEAAERKIDILVTGDDFGSQEGLLVSPAMWREYLRAGFKSFIDLGKAYDAKVMHHTCGSVYQLIPEMIDCGLDILQSLQPEAKNMDPARIKQEFGEHLCFQGGLSIQRILTSGTPAEVFLHVEDTFRKLAPGGGYIACTSHNIMADVPIANIISLFYAYHTCGNFR